MKAKVINNLNFSKKEYLKWCEENGFDKDEKLSKLKYIAELGNEDAQKMLKAVEEGKLDVERLSFSKMSFDELTDDEIEEGVEHLLKGLLYLTGSKDFADGDDNPLSQIEDRKLIRPMMDAFVYSYYEKIMDMINALTNGCNMAIDLGKITMKVKNLIDEKESEHCDSQA